MTKRIAVALAALLVAGLSARADYCRTTTHNTPGWKVVGGCDCHFHFERGKQVPLQAGPWYLYWPMEAQFVAPAPVGPYPFYPTRQVLPKMTLGPPGNAPAPPAAVPAVPAYAAPAAPAAAAPTPAYPSQPAPAAAQGLRPAAYTPAFQRTSFSPGGADVPSYWFDR